MDRTGAEVFSLAVHPTDPGVVVVGRRDWLWKTSDGGKSWIALAYPTLGPYVPLAVAIAASHPNLIYVAMAREGVFRNDAEGYRWADASKGLPEASAGGEAPRDPHAGGSPPEPGHRLHRAGASWDLPDDGRGGTWHYGEDGLVPGADFIFIRSSIPRRHRSGRTWPDGSVCSRRNSC